MSAVDAWLSSTPGSAYANVRQPIISTLKLVHLMPVYAVWAGQERNAHLDGSPLILTRTGGTTRFLLVVHIGNIGNTLVVGSIGMGKSVLDTWRCSSGAIPGGRILTFDMGRSIRFTVLGLGCEHYDLDADGCAAGAIAFQPLARIEQYGFRAWASEWIAGHYAFRDKRKPIDLEAVLAGIDWE
ncbi:type IV secretory pathway VirB4 component [Rhodoferax antarcticus]|nr:type IV secretory pathway VirB4 component [Rhodoferax antarcticus]